MKISHFYSKYEFLGCSFVFISLVVPLLKAGYFPHFYLLEVSLGYNPNFVWCSIWNAHNICLLGWCIGGALEVVIDVSLLIMLTIFCLV
jgi:hypothetical protein